MEHLIYKCHPVLQKPKRVGKKFKTYNCLVIEKPNSHAICTVLTPVFYSLKRKSEIALFLIFHNLRFLTNILNHMRLYLL